MELQRELSAEVIDLTSIEQRWRTRVTRSLVGSAITQALLAWMRRDTVDAVFADRESTGFVLAALWKLRKSRPRLIILGHFLTPPKKQLLFRLLRLHKSVDIMIVHSSMQRQIAESRLKLHPEQVAMIPYHSDTTFWSPIQIPTKNQICSAGLEFRDHSTLVEAVRDLDVHLVIAAASHWSKHQVLSGSSLPPNVQISSFDYDALRTLYSESLFVVVPLKDVDNQAGITTILEAMAMSRAVVVTHTRGQVDVVRDRRRRSRGDPLRVSQPDWIQQLGADRNIAQGQTGIYVMPGDAAELRRAIIFLLENPEQAQLMGANARRAIESTMTLDHYVQRISALVTGNCATTYGSSISN